MNKQSQHGSDGSGEEDLQNDGVIAVEDTGQLAARREAGALKYKAECYAYEECKEKVGVLRYNFIMVLMVPLFSSLSFKSSFS
ncbi:MAG: hypothetical protein MZV63_31460 [Marinilabiliales bacterium]|nr:hypothetical protein [Marinilabiliales bacterium]